jgi:uncharacterized membrane protein YjjP (DUF1212 family)
MAGNHSSSDPTRTHSADLENISNSQNSSNTISRAASVEGRPPRTRGRVKFSIRGADDNNNDGKDDKAMEPLQLRKPLPTIRYPPGLPMDKITTDAVGAGPSSDVTEESPFREVDWAGIDRKTTIDKVTSALTAQERASRLANRLGGSYSAPTSRRNSVEDSSISSPEASPIVSGNRKGSQIYPVKVDDIPLTDLNKTHKRRGSDRRPYSLYDDSTDEDDDNTGPNRPIASGQDDPKFGGNRLIRAMTKKFNLHRDIGSDIDLTTPDEDYHPPQYKRGVLSSLLQLYDGAGSAMQHTLAGGTGPTHRDRRYSKETTNLFPVSTSTRSSPSSSVPTSGPPSATASGTTTPSKRAKWYKPPSHSSTSFTHLLASGTPPTQTRPGNSRSRSSGVLSAAIEKIKHPGRLKAEPEHPRLEHAVEIHLHIRTVIERQKYLVKMCRALMMYGAPTHRLEDYLRMSARALQINGQFMYLPGCMLISFDDYETHTAEVKLVKETQGVDLGRFNDVFEIYKNVIHQVADVSEAMGDLTEVMARKERYSTWVRILMYGFASTCVGPFAFNARPSDWPICFLLGLLLGVLQLWLAPRSDEFSHVFEICAAILTSFLARAFGSIKVDGNYLFCFSAIAQSSIALILPGYTILCGSLELQSHNIVAGSVRMVYAIIYALFLGFGITIGTAVYGLMDPNAVTSVTCATPHYFDWWTGNLYLSHFPFALLYAICLIIINQGKWKQAPVMILIASAGYQVNYWSAKRFANNVQIANALGAFAIGSLANIYSRFFHGLAAAALLPAIFVQVSFEPWFPTKEDRLCVHTPRSVLTAESHLLMGFSFSRYRVASQLPAVSCLASSRLSRLQAMRLV